MKTCLDVAQAFPVRQLRERHRQKLIPAREALEIVIASITGDAFGKLLVWKMLHQLRKDGASEIHASLSRLSLRRSQCHFSRFPFQIVPEQTGRQLAHGSPFISPQLNFPRTAVTQPIESRNRSRRTMME